MISVLLYMRTKTNTSTRWAVIEDGNYTHILPIALIDEWDTKEEAEQFLTRIKSLNNPIITDGDGKVLGTYIGHTLSTNCMCSPTPQELDAYCLVHHQFN